MNPQCQPSMHASAEDALRRVQVLQKRGYSNARMLAPRDNLRALIAACAACAGSAYEPKEKEG
jgi:hypothetical protein